MPDQKAFFAEVAAHEGREDQQAHAVVAGEARGGAVFDVPACHFADEVDVFVQAVEVGRGAGPVDAEAVVDEFDEDDAEQHGDAHGEHPAFSPGVLFPEIEEEEDRHDEEGDGVEGAEVGEGHQVEEGSAFSDEVVEEVENRFVDGKPETVVSRQVPAQEQGGAQDVQPDDAQELFR